MCILFFFYILSFIHSATAVRQATQFHLARKNAAKLLNLHEILMWYVLDSTAAFGVDDE